MINPELINTIRVGELPSEPFNLTDNIPHEIGTELKRGTVQQLADLIASVIEVTGGVGFRAVSVTDGQTLPTTTQQEFILVGKGTYFNVAGGDTIVLTEELNALVSNGSFWFVGVEIPINVELAGITQEVREGFLSTTPSEDAVFKFVQNLDLSTKENTSNKQNSLSADGTGVKFPTVDAVNGGLATKISGTGTTSFLPIFTGSGTIGNSSFFESPSGVVGIGTTTPSAYFGKTIEIAGANGGSLVLKGSSVEAVLFTNNGGGSAAFGTNTNHPLDVTVNGLPKARFHTDNSLTINTITNNGQGALQVNGNITASPATLSNQVVVKSQLDLKADLASPALTGTPTAPTATAGTNTTQIATTAFVLANTNANGLLEFNATDRTVWNNGKGDVATNTSFGASSLRSNTTGQNNTSYGVQSLSNLTSGNANTSIGRAAGLTTSVGNLTTSDSSVFVGSFTSPLNDNETNQIVIGTSATGAGSNTATLGNTSITKTVLRGTVEAPTVVSSSLAGTGTRLVNASPTGQLGAITTLPVFADNTAAIAGGLGVGALYRTVIGLLAIVF